MRVNAAPTSGFQKHELDCVFRPCANHGSLRGVLSKPDLSLLDEITDGGAEAIIQIRNHRTSVCAAPASVPPPVSTTAIAIAIAIYRL